MPKETKTILLYIPVSRTTKIDEQIEHEINKLKEIFEVYDYKRLSPRPKNGEIEVEVKFSKKVPKKAKINM